MASKEASPYADAMVYGKSEEHAALIALLQAQPDGLSWPEIAAELLEVGSAVEVWERHAPAPALIDLPGLPTDTGSSPYLTRTIRYVCAGFTRRRRSSSRWALSWRTIRRFP
jgi:hypothetical protein